MKICRVTPILYPSFVGGLAIHCHELSNCQSKDGHQVTVLTVKRGIDVEEVTRHYNLKKFTWFKMPWDFLDMENPICPGLWWELLRSDFDILHVHSHLFFTTIFSVIISKIKDKPCVVTVHGVRAVRGKTTNLLQEIWLRTLSRLIFIIAKRIFCQTQADAEEIRNYVSRKKNIELIPNGINTDLFKPCNSNNGYILWVGRFVAEKGLKYLVEAFGNIAKEFPNKKVVLVGYGPLEQEIMRRVDEKGLSNVFEHLGKCSQQEIAKLMRSCELFVLPSLQEGFPKSLLEAMACGKPVITIKSLKEIVNGAGITVDPANAGKLADAIREILSDPFEGEKMGLNGRKLVERNWSWNIIVKKIEKSYSTLLAEK